MSDAVRPPQVIKIEIGGNLISVGTRGLLMRHLAENELRSVRRQIFGDAVRAAAALDKTTAEALLIAAYREYAQSAIFMDDELNAWLLSASGQRWRFGEALRAADAKIEQSQVDSLYSIVTRKENDQIDEHHYAWLNPDWKEELKKQEEARKQATEEAVIQRWIDAGLIAFVKSEPTEGE